MILNKLIGYNAGTGIYTNPGNGQIENLPKPPFAVSNAVLPDYDDFSSLPENWDRYAKDLVCNNAVGFKDWLCLRSQIRTLIEAIAGSDFVNWDDLTAEQKILAMTYMPTKVVDALGFTFFATQAGGSDKANEYLNQYNRNAETARTKRLSIFGDFGYYGLGKDQGLALERMYQVLALDHSFILRGVLFEAEDNIPGIGDWILGTNGYGTTGLKPLLVDQTFNLLPGFPYTINQFCDILVYNILQNGNY